MHHTSFLIALLSFASFAWAADPSSGKKLLFSDDFNGEVLDATKWVISGKPEAVTLAKGPKDKVLRITLVNGPDMIQWNGVSTRGKFEQAFGYFEASVRFNVFVGHTGKFGISQPDNKVTPNANLLWEGTGGERLSPWGRLADEEGQKDIRPEGKGNYLKAGEASKKFNTYGILWTEKSYVWYLNGKQINKYDRVKAKGPMMISLGHGCGEWERDKLNLKQLPDDVEFDWVKVWK